MCVIVHMGRLLERDTILSSFCKKVERIFISTNTFSEDTLRKPYWIDHMFVGYSHCHRVSMQCVSVTQSDTQCSWLRI